MLGCQCGNDLGVGIPDLQPAKQREVLAVEAVAQDGSEDVGIAHPVALAGHEVLDAIGRCAMDNAGPRFQVHIIGRDHCRGARISGICGRQWMRKGNAGKCGTGARGHDLARQPPGRETRFDAIVRDQQHLMVLVGRKFSLACIGMQPSDADQGVDKFRVDVQGLIGGKRPGRGGPDHRRHVAGQRLRVHVKCAREAQLRVLIRCKRDIDRRVGFVGILHLGLGQGRAAIKTPVHGLEPAEDKAFLKDFFQRAQLVGLGLWRHGGVGPLPLAQNAQSDEVFFLSGDLFVGIAPRFVLDLGGGQAFSKLLFDLNFNGHAVAIPPGHVARIKTGQRFRFHDHVFQNFVDRVADVDVAVGIGWAVVQHKEGSAVGDGANALVDPFVLPLPNPGGLTFREVAAHRKAGLGEIDAAVGGGRRRVSGVGRGFSGHDGRSSGVPWRHRVGFDRSLRQGQ